MSAPLKQVFDTARTFLNDDNAETWPDQTLMEKSKEAHRELQTQLWIVGSPIVRATTAPITVAPGVTNLVSAQLQPADLLVPTALYEATPGQADWQPMTEQAYFAVGLAPTTILRFWSWFEEQILFIGSTVSRQIIIHYRRLIPIPDAIDKQIGITFGELYIAARTAALAAGTVGNQAVYEAMTNLAKENLNTVIAANRGQQKTATRP